MEPRNPLAPTQHPDEPTCSRPQRLIQSGTGGARMGGAMGRGGSPRHRPGRTPPIASTEHQAERRDVSFCSSFHLTLLGPTGARTGWTTYLT